VSKYFKDISISENPESGFLSLFFGHWWCCQCRMYPWSIAIFILFTTWMTTSISAIFCRWAPSFIVNSWTCLNLELGGGGKWGWNVCAPIRWAHILVTAYRNYCALPHLCRCGSPALWFAAARYYQAQQAAFLPCSLWPNISDSSLVFLVDVMGFINLNWRCKVIGLLNDLCGVKENR